ncbi:MAG: FumA C-terminus/TtdB family hydratase beta subunit [Desulfovibrionaceae bacterium]
MNTHELVLPVSDHQVDTLHVGDTVYLSGIVCTGRDMGHLELKKLIDNKQPLPVNFKGGAVFHAGPVTMKKDKGWELRVIGPTTSIRMEPHADWVGELGVKIIIGKGGMGEKSLKAFARHKQVYLQAAPGCAVMLASGVKKVLDVFWLEKGMPEAMWVLEVEHFGPFVVTMDAHEHSRYAEVKTMAMDYINKR